MEYRIDNYTQKLSDKNDLSYELAYDILNKEIISNEDKLLKIDDIVEYSYNKIQRKINKLKGGAKNCFCNNCSQKCLNNKCCNNCKFNKIKVNDNDCNNCQNCNNCKIDYSEKYLKYKNKYLNLKKMNFKTNK